MWGPAPESWRIRTRTPSNRSVSTRRRPCSRPPRRRAASPAPPGAGSRLLPPAGVSSLQGNAGPITHMTRLIGGLDRLVAAILSGGRWLLLPVVLLLFLQWPLRDLVRAWSRDANDLGPWLFALYVAMGFTAATRADTHPPPDPPARPHS